MSRLASAVLSWLSSFAVAYLVGSKIRDRRTGVRAGLFAATVATVVSLVAYTVVEGIERRGATAETARESPAGND